MRAGLLVVLACGLLGLAGCSGGAFSAANPAAGAEVSGVKLTGTVHGGQSPIVGSQVYLFAANTTGYGGTGLAASSSNASVSLLTSAVLTNNPSNSGIDGSGRYYVTSDPNGNFSITGDYTCAAGQQVYLYALGGTQGGIANPAAGLLAALGSCPGTPGTTNDTFSSGLYAVVNEVSTIAAAYAFAGFATDATHVSSSGTALAQTGIMNAFANAANLETIGTGMALATTPAGNGAVPQAEINTLANILAACVNSNGTGSGCTTLFADALSGGTTGTQPTDTATAAINIAHNPAANVAALYALSTSNPPFAGGLTGKPNDFTVAINFTGGGLDDPTAIAIDAAGAAWITNYEGNSITKLSASGAAVLSGTGIVGGSLYEPNGVAIDGTGNAWIAGNLQTYEFSGSGSFVRYPQGYTSGINGSSVAVDGLGDAWFSVVNTLAEYSNSGNAVSPPNPYLNHGLEAMTGLSVAIDGSGSAWIANSTGTVTVVCFGELRVGGQWIPRGWRLFCLRSDSAG